MEKWEAAALPPTNLSALDALVIDFIKEEALCEARLLRLGTCFLHQTETELSVFLV